MINQDKLKELLNYNPDTGIFTWRKRSGRQAGWEEWSGYRRIMINGKAYLEHRLAWLYVTGELPKEGMDHINHNKSDNRWTNLREANQLINNRNHPKRSDNTSGFTGVCFVKSRKKWRAEIRVNSKKIYLGLFSKFSDAVSARKQANLRYGFHENHGRSVTTL